jgi:hypothetical protein
MAAPRVGGDGLFAEPHGAQLTLRDKSIARVIIGAAGSHGTAERARACLS